MDDERARGELGSRTLRGMPPPQLRRLVIPNVFMALIGAMFLADGLSTAGGETFNPFEIVPGVVLLAGGVWNLFLTYWQVYRPAKKSDEQE